MTCDVCGFVRPLHEFYRRAQNRTHRVTTCCGCRAHLQQSARVASYDLATHDNDS